MTFDIDFEALARDSGDGIVIADASGTIVFWNRAAERLFGYAAGEATGQSLDLIIPERFRARHWDGYKVVMQSGVTRYGADVLRVPALHKEGRAISIAFTVCLIHGRDGRPRGIAAFVRDDTVRWQEERALRRRLAELEGR